MSRNRYLNNVKSSLGKGDLSIKRYSTKNKFNQKNYPLMLRGDEFLYDIDREIINKNKSKLDLQRVTIYVHVSLYSLQKHKHNLNAN